MQRSAFASARVQRLATQQKSESKGADVPYFGQRRICRRGLRVLLPYQRHRFSFKNIDAIEKNCAYIERFVRPDGLLDSHVYYEDQVIKDGPVLQAQMFAVNAFRLMAQIEKLLAREKKSAYYTDIARRLADSAVQDFPVGFWSPEKTVLIFD